ncbi:replication protein A 70 kDa DNA-binding subunit [Trifolium repens]|nr:replication protein A 70 kDa DNA-binding subunit [Trifolium repens]
MNQELTLALINTISNEFVSDGLRKPGAFHIRTTLTLILALSFPGNISAALAHFSSTLLCPLYTILDAIALIAVTHTIHPN